MSDDMTLNFTEVERPMDCFAHVCTESDYFGLKVHVLIVMYPFYLLPKLLQHSTYNCQKH